MPSPLVSLNKPPIGESDGWLRQAGYRALRLWPLKAFGTMGFMLLFFWGYFWVMRYPLATHTVMPLTIIDEWIPFTPAAFGFYISLWLYVSLPPAFLLDLRQLLGYGLWIGALCMSCLIIFWVWPTTIPPFELDWAKYPTIAQIKGLDISGNACPSLHVATAVFSAAWLQHILRHINAPRWIAVVSWIYCLVITWSTIAVRQHVAIDTLAGTAVGLIFAALSLNAMTRRDIQV
jgi:membrane-associated phospholipid phosphatase